MDTEDLNQDLSNDEQIKENLIQDKNEEPDEKEEVLNENKNKIEISSEIQIEIKTDENINAKIKKNDDIDDNSDGKDNNNINLKNQNPNNNISNENNINSNNSHHTRELYVINNRDKKHVKVSAKVIMVILIIIHYAPSPACFAEFILNIIHKEDIEFELFESIFYFFLWIILIFKIIFHKGSKRRFFPCLNALSTICVLGLIIMAILNIVNLSKGGRGKTKLLFQIRVILYIVIIVFDVGFFILIIILIIASKNVNLSFIKIR